MSEPKVEFQWVMWYGDYTLSQVNYKCFMKLDLGIIKFESHIRLSKREVYKRGILQACKDYCRSIGCQTDDWNMNDALGWFKRSQVDESVADGNLLRNDSCNITDKYSTTIRRELLKHVSKSSEAAVREHKLQNSGKNSIFPNS